MQLFWHKSLDALGIYKYNNMNKLEMLNNLSLSSWHASLNCGDRGCVYKMLLRKWQWWAWYS